MAKSTKKQEQSAPITRAEKKDATKNLIKELLIKKEYKHNELIDEVSKTYAERFSGEETDNINDVKGRVGSVLDILKKDGEVVYEGGVYALKKEKAELIAAEKPAKRTRKTAKKEESVEKEEKKQTAKKATKTKTVKSKEKEKEEKEEREEVLPLPPAPLQPIAPVAPITPEVAPEPIPPTEPAPKKRGRKPKEKTEAVVEVKSEQAESAPVEERAVPQSEKKEEKTEEPIQEVKTEKSVEPVNAESVKEEQKNQEIKEEKPIKEVKKEAAPKGVVMDMSFLFGDPKPLKTVKAPEKTEEKKVEKAAEVKETPAKQEQKVPPKAEVKEEPKKAETKVEPKKTEAKPQEKKPIKESVRKLNVVKTVKTKTADEKLQEAFLNRLHRLGGEYFEYYSVYLLEKYSRKNGRRLEGLKITGGDHDGGIDGEIELTDRFGFRETIYIQSKNWDPDKGDERLWVVGETLLQQFVGACMCRQAKDGKQNCRGIFITTSRFTPDAKRILADMSDKFVGYDGAELYETAKECEFGLIKRNGEWALDEALLSGEKAFFNLF